jgi:GNAT superfamily N-acetyltransferase
LVVVAQQEPVQRAVVAYEEVRVARAHVEISRATVEDVDDLVLLWGRSRDEFNAAHRALASIGIEAIRKRLILAMESGEIEVFLARRDDQLVGYALVRSGQFMPLHDAQAVTVEQLFVEPSERRQGIARSLLGQVAAHAERIGAEQIVTNSPPGARESQRFLARLGFSPMLVRRTTSTGALRRKLSGERRSNALEALLSRRRSLRARSGVIEEIPEATVAVVEVALSTLDPGVPHTV